MTRRFLVVALLAVTLTAACGRELSPGELAAASVANLKSAKTAHLDVTGSVALRGALSFSAEIIVTGDVSLPDRSRMTIRMPTLMPDRSLETVMIGDTSWARNTLDGTWSTGGSAKSFSTMVDPLRDLNAALTGDVVEVDRPIVDGRRTRHLRYPAASTKILDGLAQAAGLLTGVVITSGSPVEATGELWIRVDDAQLVRQVVRLSFDFESAGHIGLWGGGGGVGRTAGELTLDMRVSHHGARLPQITAPPVQP